MTKEILSSSETIKLIGEYSIQDLLGGNLMPRDDIREVGIYNELGKIPLVVYESNINNSKEIIIKCFPLTGLKINALSHFGAPSTSFGLDTSDVIKDWKDIFDPTNNDLLKKHIEHYIGPEGWEIFQNCNTQILKVIEEDYSMDWKNTAQTITPVIYLKKAEGKYNWNFQKNPYGMCELGPVLIAAYSRDITSKWPKQEGHQKIAATQALGAIFKYKDDLWNGVLLKQIIGLVETGIINPVTFPAADIVQIPLELPVLPVEDPEFLDDTQPANIHDTLEFIKFLEEKFGVE